MLRGPAVFEANFPTPPGVERRGGIRLIPANVCLVVCTRQLLSVPLASEWVVACDSRLEGEE